MGTMPGRRRAEINEEQCRQLLQRSAVPLVVCRGVEQVAEIVNDAFTRLFGYTMDDLPDVAHWWPLAYHDEVYRESVRALNGKRGPLKRWLTKAQSTRWI